METTVTPFLRGALRVHQPVRGYRFNMDSVLLSGFAWVREGEDVLDLGTGTGILLLLLGHRHHPRNLVGVEIDPEMARLAARNLEENGWADRSLVVNGDLRRTGAPSGGAFPLVVCNPPYYPVRSGRSLPDPARAQARQQGSANPEEIASSAGRNLAPGGRFCLCCPFPDLPAWAAALRASGLHLRLVRAVRHGPNAEPYLALVQAALQPAECLTLPDLEVRLPGGAYGPEAAGWLGDAAPPPLRTLCDAMVGKLARYLRLLGVPTGFARNAADGWLLEEARRTGALLLTRDRPLLARSARRGIRALDPLSDSPAEQLQAVARAFGPFPEGAPPLCLDCGAPGLEVDRREALGRVPAYTFLTHRRFSCCPCCGKLTWEGSHLERFRRDVLEGGHGRAGSRPPLRPFDRE
ncbi:MAG: Mut7-C RNAse domain-containing protein [Acidobacteriota bacterium]